LNKAKKEALELARKSPEFNPFGMMRRFIKDVERLFDDFEGFRFPSFFNREPFPLGADLSLETFPVPHTTESVALSVVAPEGRLVYTGDTGPSGELARWATGCDILLAECSLPESLVMDIHLTPERAGDLAREAKAKQLVLTHFYPPVETSDPAKGAATRFSGPVTAARDGDRFTIGGT